jgi:hypothetical protein
MKTISKLTLAGLTAALVIPVGALASDTERIAIDNHHGSVTYYHRPMPRETTVAFYGNEKGLGHRDQTSTRSDVRAMSTSTPQGGPVTYYGPAR